jgi:hypothetical protein
MIDELKERLDTKTPALVFRAIEPSFGWDTVVGYLQHCADNDAGEPVDILNYRLPMAEQIDSIRPVFEYLNENLDNVEVLGADLYSTFTTRGNVKYSSKNDILIWNVIGQSDLSINEEDRVVEPGDLIYVPANTEYTFKPQGARAYVTFGVRGK